MKRAPNLKHQPKDKMTEVIIFAGSDAWHMRKSGANGPESILRQMIHIQLFLDRNNWRVWQTRKSSTKGAITCAFIVLVKYQSSTLHR